MGRVRKWGRRGKVVVPEPRMMEGVRGNMGCLRSLGEWYPEGELDTWRQVMQSKCW